MPDLRLGTAAIGDSLEVDDFGEYTEMLVPAINLRNGESTVRIGFAADVPMSSTIIMDDGMVSSTIIKELVLLPSVSVVITPPVAEGTEGTTVPLDSQYKVHVAARKLVQDEVVRRKLASLEANRAWWTDEVCPKLSDKEYGDARRNTSEAPRKIPRAAGERGLPSAELVFRRSGAVFRRSSPTRCRVPIRQPRTEYPQATSEYNSSISSISS